MTKEEIYNRDINTIVQNITEVISIIKDNEKGLKGHLADKKTIRSKVINEVNEIVIKSNNILNRLKTKYTIPSLPINHFISDDRYDDALSKYSSILKKSNKLKKI